eukprot:672044-Ditylum_brightwellii.AAC.1
MHSTANHSVPSTKDRRTEKIPHHTQQPDDSDHLDEDFTLENLDGIRKQELHFDRSKLTMQMLIYVSMVPPNS